MGKRGSKFQAEADSQATINRRVAAGDATADLILDILEIEECKVARAELRRNGDFVLHVWAWHGVKRDLYDLEMHEVRQARREHSTAFRPDDHLPILVVVIKDRKGQR